MGYKEFAKAVMADPTTNPANSTGLDFPVLGHSQSSHKFPEDLWAPGQEPFIYFNIRESIDPTAKSVGNISMYMPPTIKVDYGAGWEETAMDDRKLKALTGFDVAQAASNLSDGQFKKTFTEATDSIAKGFSGKDVLRYGISNAAESMLNPAYASAIRRGTAGKNQVVNPFTSMLYQGPVLRVFNLEFSLYARNAKESESIQKITKAFKLAMHPNAEKGTESVFFDFPYVFDVFFITPATDKMFNIKRAVLTDMSVNYAGNNQPSFFNISWAPVDVRLSLTFKELELLTKDDIEQNF